MSGDSPTILSPRRLILQIAGVATVYVIAALLGLQLQIPGTNSSPVWPPTGIAFASLLLLGSRVWPGILIGAFAANFLVFPADLALTSKFSASALISVGNTLESVAGAWLLHTMVEPGREFDRAASVFRYVGVVLAMCLISCTIGAASVCSLVVPDAVGFSIFGDVWLTWWLGDVAGGLILTPAIIACARGTRPDWTQARWLEVAALFVLLSLTVMFVFGRSGGVFESLPYVLLVGPLWAAFRFGLRETAIASLLVSALAVFETSAGYGPFLSPNAGPDQRLASMTRNELQRLIQNGTTDAVVKKELDDLLNQGFLTLQIFVCAIGTVGVTLSAAVAERDRTQAELQELNISLEQRVAERTTELARSNEELDAFAYIASHDLKEPLRGITNFSSFLQQDYGDRLDEEGLRQIGTMQKLCLHMEHLIDSLLTFSRVGRTELAVQPTDLNVTVQEIIESIQLSLDEQGVQVRIPQPLPTVVCDHVRIGEVFRNLITNAMKYNNKSEKWAEISFRNDDETGTTEFSVRDNGIGIREKHLESVFGMFKRLHGRDKFGGGTGAGLTIVKKIVERHGGKIWVESVFGEGSTFLFTLAAEQS